MIAYIIYNDSLMYIIINIIPITIISNFGYYSLLLLLCVCMTAFCYLQIISNTNHDKYY